LIKLISGKTGVVYDLLNRCKINYFGIKSPGKIPGSGFFSSCSDNTAVICLKLFIFAAVLIKIFC